jgi:hypothetical protein
MYRGLSRDVCGGLSRPRLKTRPATPGAHSQDGRLYLASQEGSHDPLPRTYRPGVRPSEVPVRRITVPARAPAPCAPQTRTAIPGIRIPRMAGTVSQDTLQDEDSQRGEGNNPSHRDVSARRAASVRACAQAHAIASRWHDKGRWRHHATDATRSQLPLASVSPPLPCHHAEPERDAGHCQLVDHHF